MGVEITTEQDCQLGGLIDLSKLNYPLLLIHKADRVLVPLIIPKNCNSPASPGVAYANLFGREGGVSLPQNIIKVSSPVDIVT